MRFLLVLLFTSLAFAQAPKVPTTEELLESSGVQAEMDSTNRYKEMAEGEAEVKAEEAKKRIEEGDNTPINPYYMGVGTADLATGAATGFLGALQSHSRDYESIGPHLFPNVFIPDIVRIATNQAGLDEGECYERIVDMGKWCMKILYKRIAGIRVPVAVRFTPSVKYSFPVSKTESGRDPYFTRYIPKIIMGFNYDAVVNQPFSPNVTNEIFQGSLAYQKFLKTNKLGLPKEVELPDLEIIEKQSKAAEEAYKKLPRHLKLTGQREVGSSESVFLPEITSRFLVDVINEQIPNKTIAIEISWLSFIGNPLGALQTLTQIRDMIGGLNLGAKFADLMNKLKDGFYYGSALSKADFEALFKGAMDKLSKGGFFSGNLDLNQLGKEFGLKMDDLNSAIDQIGSEIGGVGGLVKVVDVKMLCHNVKRPRNLKEWNPFLDHYISYFLTGDIKKPQGFFHLSRFQRVFLPLHPELAFLLKEIGIYEQDPFMCSKINPIKQGEVVNIGLREVYPKTLMCDIGMFLGYPHIYADTPNDPQMSMRGAHTGFMLASIFRDDMAYKFDKDFDKFSWVSPDPEMPKVCGPLFQTYQWSGSQNPEGDANIMMPMDFPNVAIQWRRFHCCVDPGSWPMGWDEIKE